MITRHIINNTLLVFLTTISLSLYSQIDSNDLNERYLSFNDLATVFVYSDDCVTIESFQLYNIKEGESSKPIHIAVNDLSGVIKFSIESSSSVYENQRRCKLVMYQEQYINTFRLVIYNMGVKFILYNGNRMEVEEFIELLKN